MNELLPQSLRRILQGTPELNRCYLVGGCVRDWLLGVATKDFDIEVFGISESALIQALGRWGKVDLVGRSFGVIKVGTDDGRIHDFSLPRRDSKVGIGHQGFAVEFDPAISPREAAARRDFTVNSLMWDARTGELLDFFGGAEDLRNRVLRHTSGAFPEDPLRVLRGMQFAGRFNLVAAPETIELSRGIKAAYAELAIERVREEWMKWATRSTRPSAGLEFLKQSEWLEHFPELAALVGVPQDAEWHPEGDAWVHTLHCVDALVQLPEWLEGDDELRGTLSLAVLTHDLGKATHTKPEPRNGKIRIVSPGHEAAGGPLAESFLQRIGATNEITGRVPKLVTNHMMRVTEISPRAIRRLAHRLAPTTIEQLVVVMTADAFGRPPLPKEVPASVELIRSKSARLSLQSGSPKPVLLGRHLIARGMKPGPEFGKILEAAFEAQLDGEFEDLEGATRWLEARLATGIQTPESG